MQQSSSKREVYRNTILPQETRNTSNKQPNLTPKAIGEKEQKTPKVRRRKEIIKTRSEIKRNEGNDSPFRYVRTHREVGSLQPARGPSPDPDHAATLVLDV